MTGGVSVGRGRVNSAVPTCALEAPKASTERIKKHIVTVTRFKNLSQLQIL